MIRFHAFVRKSLSKKLYVDTITPSKCCTDICSLLHVTRYNVSYTPNVLGELKEKRTGPILGPTLLHFSHI